MNRPATTRIGVSVAGARLDDMTDNDRELLAFEEAHPRNDRRKEAVIRSTFGFSWVRYHQRLMTLTKDADAVAEFPQVIRRMLTPAPGLRRLRDDAA